MFECNIISSLDSVLSNRGSMILHNIRPGGQPHLRMGILPTVLFFIHIQFALKRQGNPCLCGLLKKSKNCRSRLLLAGISCDEYWMHAFAGTTANEFFSNLLDLFFIVYGGRRSTHIHLGGLVCHTDVATSI
jgi:hypothetical protein